MTKKDNLIKFRHGNQKGLFTYSIVDGEFVTLAEKDSSKIDYIRDHGSIDLIIDLDGETYDIMNVDVIYDKDYIKKIYNHFIETGNAYFKDGFDNLVVLRFHK